jgi:hypothetical protein
VSLLNLVRQYQQILAKQIPLYYSPGLVEAGRSDHNSNCLTLNVTEVMR